MSDEDFKDRSRTAKKHFSRNRVLNFTAMVLLLIQKSAKSMQLVLNEFSLKQKLPLVTSSAFSQARKHLKPEAFIELNRKSIVAVMYGDDAYRTYKGYRVLGIDGSKVYLPPEPEIIKKDGGTVPNQHREKIEPYSLVSVLYDELNEIALDAVLGQAKAYEVDLAMGHLSFTQAGD